MNIVTEIKEWQSIRKSMTNQSIGFVPTMGYLHEGHVSLCKQSKAANDVTVVSIFVNPAQFNQASDLACYPRDFEQDMKLLHTLSVDYLFCPEAAAMYPDQYQVQLIETDLSRELEGNHRPGHFNGMLTVVLKLLNLIQPQRAYFGEKDYQQLLLVKKMVQALFITVDIISCPTIRADNGLALSSRNARLTAEQRAKAAHLPALLNSTLKCADIAEQLVALGFKVDYIAEKWQRRLAAVWLDEVRLIDNFPI